MPLIVAQINPTHLGWIDQGPLSTRLWDTGVSFLIGETGHVIAEPPRERYALIPAALVAVALLLAFTRGSGRERRGAALGLVVGLGVVALTSAAALLGRDYIVERNLLPALIPLGVAAAIGFGASGARRVGLVLATVLCAYWLAFDIHVTRTENLQRPDFRELTEKAGPPLRPRAIVTWVLAADGVQFYLEGKSERIYSGPHRVREVDVVSKPVAAGRPIPLPPSFHPVERLRLKRLTLVRYVSRRPREIWFYTLRDLPTGFGRNAVVLDGGAR